MTTPIVFFTFNRADLTRCVLDALKQQTIHPPLLLIFSDAARSVEDEAKIAEVRSLISSITWTDVQIVRRETNRGCNGNIITGLDEVFSSYESAVIVEDDILPCPSFYESMVKLLEFYKRDSNVFSVGAFPHLLNKALTGYQYDVFMSPHFSAWGWGTWMDRWQRASQHYTSIPNVKLPVTVSPALSWDMLLNEYCKSSNLIHALTTNYLVQNLGLDTGVHYGKHKVTPKMARFLKKHTSVLNRVPMRFPEAVLLPTFIDAIQNYINASAKSNQTFNWRNTIAKFLPREAKTFLKNMIKQASKA